jgi:hypothetical protein
LVHLYTFIQVEVGEEAKYNQSDDFLNRFEFDDGKLVAAYPIGGDLKTIFEEGDSPANQDCEYDRGLAIF